MYRILVIVPRAGGSLIDTSAELNQITRYYKTVIMSEEMTGRPVTAGEVLRATVNESYDIVHIASHGMPDGVLMANNTVLTADQALRMGKAVRARLIYINTCSGSKLAQYMVDHGIPAVIASNYDQQDLTAWSVAAYFYEFLSQNNGDVLGAFRMAKPSDGGMSIWLSDAGVAEISPLVKTVDALMARSEQRDITINGIDASVRVINARVRKLFWFHASLWVALIGMILALWYHIFTTTWIPWTR